MDRETSAQVNGESERTELEVLVEGEGNVNEFRTPVSLWPS